MNFNLDLNEIPTKTGFGKTKDKLVYDWKNSIGKKIYITDLNGNYYEYKIINYEKDKSYIEMIDSKNEKYRIRSCNLINGKLSLITKHIMKEFRLNVGDFINDNDRNLKIINRKIINQKKYYTCKCLICNGEYDIWERHLLTDKSNCPYCLGRRVLIGFNDLNTIRPDLIKYLKHKEDGEQCTIYSNKRMELKCPDCNFEKVMRVYKLSNKGFSCPRCSDNISYSEKFMISLLDQLNIKYIYQLTKKSQEWCDSFMYDFYIEIEKEKIIIETNGCQHYEINGFQKLGNYTLEDTVNNDYTKRQLALSNGITDYIELDCRNSNLNWLKKSILESNLPIILDFKESDIDWSKCEEATTKSYVKIACQIKKENPSYTIEKIGDVLQRSNPTIISYLKKGKTLGWL